MSDTIERKNLGLYRKYEVTRTDGSSAPMGKHENCEYFVIDLAHDTLAVNALRAYAEACKSRYPKLARDLRFRANALALHDYTRSDPFGGDERGRPR